MHISVDLMRGISGDVNRGCVVGWGGALVDVVVWDVVRFCCLWWVWFVGVLCELLRSLTVEEGVLLGDGAICPERKKEPPVHLDNAPLISCSDVCTIHLSG